MGSVGDGGDGAGLDEGERACGPRDPLDRNPLTQLRLGSKLPSLRSPLPRGEG